VALVVVTYVCLVPPAGFLAVLFAAAVALSVVWPGRRRAILSALAVAVCLLSNVRWTRPAIAATLAGVVWIAALAAWTRLLPRLPRLVERHSLAALHAGAVLGLAGACALAARGKIGVAAALCALAPELLWRSSYWIKWRIREGPHAPVWDNLFAALPFIGSGGVPTGKGPGYLARHEAASDRELAEARWSGVRLLLLSLAWRAAGGLIAALLCGAAVDWVPAWLPSAGPILPAMDALLKTPRDFPLWERWAGLYLELVRNILAVASYGHLVVGVFSLFGFRIPRSTRAPLLATTVLDFWSRYYFYFKELLMDFFFFPAFLRAPRLPGLARTLAATFAAAFCGNVYFHVLMYARGWALGDAAGFRALVEARLVYCGLLALALSVSFARALRRGPGAPRANQPRRCLQMAMVSAIFALLHVWSFAASDVTVAQRLDLWRSLAGW
jgi:hypothetical protein